jgi:CHAD domain-containing protein
VNGVTTELIAAERPSSAAVREALAPEFELRLGEAVTVQRVYLDTFDGLLYAEGLSLRWERGRLELRARDAELPSEAAACPEPDRPLPATGLPPGGLRDALSGVIDVRALLPQARVRVATESIAVLDGMQKTVARLLLETPELISPTGHAKPLGARVRLLGVRGYDEALERVRERLGATLSLEPAERTLQDDAVLAAGGVPEGVGSKLDVRLTPGQRADAAAVAVLRRLLEIMDANLSGTLADIDTEFLHDYRVAVRRTRAVQRELRTVFAPAELAAMRAEFRWLQQATGEARDLDVYVLEFEAMRSLVPEAVRGDLDPVLTVLRNRRLIAHGQLARALRSERAAQLHRDWEALLDGLVGRAYDDRPDAIRPIGEVASERIRKVYRRMVKMGRAIGAGGVESPAEEYHELRKKGKELRYLLELFGVPLYDSEVVRPMIKTLKALQDVLGHHQDLEVQTTMLRGLRDDVASMPGGPAALMAMGVLVERLEEDAAAARAEFAGVFAPFSGKRQRELVDDTFAT